MWGAAASGPGKSPSPCYAVVIEQRSGVQRQDFWHQLLALSATPEEELSWPILFCPPHFW